MFLYCCYCSLEIFYMWWQFIQGTPSSFHSLGPPTVARLLPASLICYFLLTPVSCSRVFHSISGVWSPQHWKEQLPACGKHPCGCHGYSLWYRSYSNTVSLAVGREWHGRSPGGDGNTDTSNPVECPFPSLCLNTQSEHSQSVQIEILMLAASHHHWCLSFKTKTLFKIEASYIYTNEQNKDRISQ